MNPIIFKAAKLTQYLPLDLLIKSSNRRTILPFYHTVSDNELIHVKHLYKARTVYHFEKDLDFFLKHYKAIDYKTFKVNLQTGKPTKENTFLLTFDDGLKEFHEIIAPILIRKGIPAICFLNSGFIDNKDMFFRFKASILIENLIKKNYSQVTQNEVEKWFNAKGLPLNNNYKSLLSIDYLNKHYLDELACIVDVDFKEYLQKNRPYMDSNQISSLIKQGFEFGAHSVDHPQFSTLNYSEQLFQINQSIKDVTTKFELDYKLFSFPFTDYGVGIDFFKTVFDANSPVADFTFGCAGLKNDSCEKNFQRIAIEKSNFSAEDLVYYEYFYFMLKSIVNKNTVIRN